MSSDTRSSIYAENSFSVTLLSNGSENIYPNNSLTHFTNTFPKKIKLDPSLEHYVALEEIGVDLQLPNIPIPNHSLTSIFLFNYYDKFWVKLANNFVDYPGDQYFIAGQSSAYIRNFPLSLSPRLFTLDIIENLISNYFRHSRNFFNDHKIIYIDLVRDAQTEVLFTRKYNKVLPVFLKQFCIRSEAIAETDTDSPFSFIDNFGITIHENLFFALKLHTAKLGKKQIEIYGEKYYTICIETGSEIRGGIFTEDNIHYNNNNIVEVECNLISFYPSNDTFCSTISTFNSFRNNNSFHYYIAENLNYYRLKSNEIQSGTISILNKKQETLRFSKLVMERLIFFG